MTVFDGDDHDDHHFNLDIPGQWAVGGIMINVDNNDDNENDDD